MITESRVKQGTLTLGASGGGTAPDGTAFACQATSIKVTPSYDDDGDAVETLCGDEIPAGKKEKWTLNGTSIQDFDDPEGFLAYCYENSLQTVAFEWAPNVIGAPTWAGSVVIRALEEGGDVNTPPHHRLRNLISRGARRAPTPPTPASRRTRPRPPTASTPGRRPSGRAGQCHRHRGHRGGVDHAQRGALAREHGRSAPRGGGRHRQGFPGRRSPGSRGRWPQRPAPYADDEGAGISNPLPYFGPIHYGWAEHNITAQPFVDEAVADTEREWLAVYEHAVQEAADSGQGA